MIPPDAPEALALRAALSAYFDALDAASDDAERCRMVERFTALCARAPTAMRGAGSAEPGVA